MKNIKDLFEKVRQLNINGKSKDAFTILSTLVTKNPNLKKNTIFNLEKAQTLFGMSKFNEALKYFQDVLNCDKNNIYAQKGKIKCLNHLNKHINCNSLKKIRNINDDVEIKNILYDSYIKNLQYKKALRLNNNLDYFINTIKNIVIDEKKLLSLISYFNNKSGNHEDSLFKIFSNLINKKLLFIKKHEHFKKNIITIILNNISFLNDNKKNIIREYLFNYYYQKKSKYETVIYLLDILKKPDCATKKFIKLLSILLRENSFNKKKKNIIIQRMRILKKQNINLKIKNIILNEIEILQKKILLKSKPRKLHILLTTACNIKCIMCYVSNKNIMYEINTSFINFITDVIPYLENITWQGGEVFLHNKFKKLFKFAGENDVKQNIITNGLLLNKQIINFIIKYDVELTLSIDSVNPIIYEKIRYGAHFDQLLQNLKILKEYKQIKQFYYNMTCVVMSLNYEETENLVKFAVLYGFNLISFQKVLCNDNNKFLSLTFEQEKRVFENINKLKTQYSGLIKIQNDISCEEKHKNTDTPETKTEKIKSAKTNLFCYDPWTQLFFDYDNILRINCNSKALNIKNKNNIWNNRDLISYRKHIVKNNFRHCNKLCYNMGCHL